MGKRQVGELEVSELVTTFLLSELASFSITDDGIPLLFSVIPILTLLAVEVIASFALTKSRRLKKLFIGHPTMIICKGVLDQKELARNRISLEELFGQLRLKSITSLDEIEYAILEQNGQLSVITKTAKQPVSVENLRLNVERKGIAHAIIIDGVINDYNLKVSGKGKLWVERQLEKRGVCVDDVFLFTVDDAGNELLVLRDKAL